MLKQQIFDILCCLYQIFDINLSCQSLTLIKYTTIMLKFDKTNNNMMIKEVLINPVDQEMELLANSVKILNEYKKLGFVKRDAFVEVVMGEDESYHNFEGMKLLNNFWSSRVKDKNLNDDLVKVLENLKES